MLEHERSYVFTYEGAYSFLQDQGLNLYDSNQDVYLIYDCYLQRNTRVRQLWSLGEVISPEMISFKDVLKLASDYNEPPPDADVSYIFTKKHGKKALGYRFEFEEHISQQLAHLLASDKIFWVKKIRKKLPVKDDVYQVTIDFIEEPMKLAILEVESINESCSIPAGIAEKLFGTSLIECPLCNFDLFNRHIGIAGGPSSGKTETAKILSHVLNTEYDANSFHVQEFSTTFIQKYKKTPSFWEEFFIWHGQHDREHNSNTANIIISDCPTFLTYIYLLHLPKDVFSDTTALVLAKIYKRVLFDVQWYTDLIFLNLINYKNNNIRYQSGKDEALQIEARIKSFLKDHNIAYRSYDYTQKDQIIKDLFYINS